MEHPGRMFEALVVFETVWRASDACLSWRAELA
jgi:hypothetical protein